MNLQHPSSGIRRHRDGICAQPSVAELAAALRPVLSRADVRRALIFGSLARGTQRGRSDIDLIVVMDTPKRFFDRADDLAGIREALPNVSFDLLIYTPGEFADMRERPFMRRALREGVTIYERGKG
jgi:predicted nucleotidyltransferase